MLLISARAAVDAHTKDKSPILEVLRHLRNAAAHGNRFEFREYTDKSRSEPVRPAEWGGIYIDHTKKGKRNPLYGSQCVGSVIASADVLWLLHDIDALL